MDTPQIETMPSLCKPKRKERNYRSPVKWLLGRQLLRSAKGILLYAAYGKQLDPRDWMWADVFPKRDKAGALKFWQDQLLSRQSPDEGEFWFDYISDTGDGSRATYSIAYLCLSDLYVTSLEPAELAADKSVKMFDEITEAADQKLPRGEFLLVGGDTAYHVSDYMTLAERVQNPFKWAYEDLIEDGGLGATEPNRALFGIPGNHDYYDQLNGFRRQFRVPFRKDPPYGCLEETDDPNKLAEQPQLYLPGFKRYQQASYIALRLPFDWWLWGLDTEVGQIDERQRQFFRGVREEAIKNHEPINKLIVATSAPTTVFGKLANPDDKKATDAFQQLDLEQCFLPQPGADKKHRRGVNGNYDLKTAGDEKVGPGQCRLDISGDVHHYARYWGPQASSASPIRSEATAPAPSATSYASVVSGIGGAFHHPSGTYVDEVQEQVLYPSEKVSTEEVARKIFNPGNIFDGGYVWLAGLIMAFCICFAATVTPSSRTFLNELFSAHWSAVLFSQLWYLRLGATLLLFSPLPLVLPFIPRISQSLFKKDARGALGADAKTPTRSDQSQYCDREIEATPERELWTIFAVALLLFGVGLVALYYSRTWIAPFGKSLVIHHTIIWAVAAVILSMRYSEFLTKKSHRTTIRWHDWALTWALTLSGLLGVAAALWFFGKDSRPAYLVSDLIFILIVEGAFLGLVLLPVYAGGELCQPKRAVVGEALSVGLKLRRALFGLWHAVLQILVPFLLARQIMLLAARPMTAVGLSVITLLLFPVAMWQVGYFLLKKRLHKALVVAWLLYGALMLLASYLVAQWLGEPKPFFPIEQWQGWWALAPAALAGIIGLVMSCVWFGWYLGVCFAFNGHNNEVGGACRIEEFKQFIRFRLTPTQLTAYVIGIKQPIARLRDDEHPRLKPEIIDVFHLCVKPAAESAVNDPGEAEANAPPAS